MAATLVIGTRRRAVDWCREHGVHPFAHSTHVIAWPSAARGRMVEAEDRVVFVGGLHPAKQRRVRAALAPCFPGGLVEMDERAERFD